MDAEGGEPDEQAAAAPEARMRAAAPASGVKKPKARVGGSTKIKVRGLWPACLETSPWLDAAASKNRCRARAPLSY